MKLLLITPWTACSRMKTRRLSATAASLLILVVAAQLLCGCQSMTHPGSSSLAFIEVQTSSLKRVHEATVRVFTAEQYEVMFSDEEEIVFIREGTSSDRLQYGRYQESLEMKVEVSLKPYGENKILVRADAYAVIGGSDRGAVKLLKIARRPYQKMLERVKVLAEPSRLMLP